MSAHLPLFHLKKAAAIVLLGTVLRSAPPASGEPVPDSAFRLPKDCSQLIVVTSQSWDDSKGRLQALEKHEKGSWGFFGRTTDVRLGRKGIAWGRGLVSNAGLPGPRKREGDDKAPAGIFALSFAFGYSAESPNTRLRYVPISATTVCVDDPRSRYYNRMLDASQTKQPDWRSAEQMKLTDIRYKWGVFVMHNKPPQPGAGSCIFLHVWKDPATATSGCTAMPEPMMLALIKWLDPARHPVLVQLPREFLRTFVDSNGVPLHSE